MRLWHTYICFDSNYRPVAVASIQILLAQRICDMAYFSHYHYYGHLLSIIKIYNPEETCCYARPAAVIINSNTGLKCWPCRGRTPSCHYQAFVTEFADTTTFAWILDVSQLKNGLNKKILDMNIIATRDKICATIFSTVGRQGFNLGRCGFLLV